MNKDFILSVLKKVRFLFPFVVDSPHEVLGELAQIIPSRYMIFPCDIIDLRQFIREDKISSSNPILFFSQKFADKYLKEYSVFLVLDSHVDVVNDLYGGVQVNYCDELPLSHLLVRILINEPSANNSFDVVKNLMEEFNLGVECLVSNSVPGISGPSKKLSYIIEPKKAQRTIGVPSDLPLTPKENDIFEFLRQVKKDYNLDIQMRVAGGWVRDKILGKESDDIDIAVDMPGYDFAKLVAQAAFKSNISHDPKAYNVSLDKDADPATRVDDDNLMVGAVDLFGQKIEFVPMRTEHYPDPQSRKPKITTTNDPREDVKRRDLTINSIYYNIDTGQVDDFVGGVEDLGLESGKMILRTPDDAKKTYEEDPLRLLRALRFHSRYPNSELDPDIIKSMSDPDIQESYVKKVAASRAGPEIMKMLVGDNPTASLKLLFESGLYRKVFDVPAMGNINPDGIEMDQKSPYHKYSLLDHTIEVVSNLNSIMKENEEPDDMRGLMNLAAVFHDFGKMDNKVARPHKRPRVPGHTTYVGHERSSEDMAEAILKSINVPKEKRNLVNTVIKTHMYPHDASDWSSKNKGPGNFIEKLKIKGKGGVDDLWKYVFYHGQADAMSSNPETYDEQKYNQGKEWFEQYRSEPSTEFTRFQGTLIDGNVVDNLRQQIEQQRQVRIRKNIISDALHFILQQQYTGNIDMSFASLPEGADREKAMNKSINDATNKVKGWMLNVHNKYLEPPKGGQVMGSNWFKKVKTAQVAALSGDVQTQDPEIKKGPKEALPKYQVGMKVRDRRNSVSQQQTYGVVEAIKGNKMKIVWNPDSKEKRQEEVVDMVENTEILSLIVAEV